MKTAITVLATALVLASFCAIAQEKASGTALPKGPYLGQKLPGAEPEIFAPGIVSTGMFTRDVAMTPDGKELYFSVVIGGFSYATILATKEEESGWTPPEVAPFASDPTCETLEPSISPDGGRFFFASNRSAKKGSERNFDLFVMEREGKGWSEPRPVGPPVDTEAPEFFPSVTKDGTLYFTRESANGSSDIYRSRLVDGKYAEPEKLPPQVNCGAAQFNAFISPDESLLIVCVQGRKDSLGGIDYFAVFHRADGAWSEPVDLGQKINTPKSQEYSASLSPDGKVLFFMSARLRSDGLAPGEKLTAAKLRQMHDAPGYGQPAIWWVDAGFLEGLRAKATWP